MFLREVWFGFTDYMQAMVPDLIASSGLLNEDNYSLVLENSVYNFNFMENPLLSNKLSSNYYNETSPY